MICLGHLSGNDPLYEYLRSDILPILGVHAESPSFHVYRILATTDVYLYEETGSRIRIIGKFFKGVKHGTTESACRAMEQEVNNLRYLRDIGFNCPPLYIPNPLGCNATLNALLVEEFCPGSSLDTILLEAIQEGNQVALFQKLTDLAYFLATLHHRTATQDRVERAEDLSYFDRILDQLMSLGFIGQEEAEDFHRLKERWRTEECLEEDYQVLVHGDATPTNVLFSDCLGVTAIDLERMKRADRAFDLGRMAGEIKHFFMQYAGDKGAAEPYIGHFLWEYACRFPDREGAFRSIVRRIPFYMGMTLLRIARNPWIIEPYRRQLLNEARETLR